MKPLVIDVEGSMDGHVFNYNHKMYMLGLYNGEEKWVFPIEWDSLPYGGHIRHAQGIIDRHDLLIGANFKHDIQWCRRYGLKTQHKKIWCLQYAEFCLSGQTWRMPDLDTACKNRGLEGKLDTIHVNYWDKGLEINAAPWDEACAYNRRDLEQELALFRKQVEVLQGTPQLKRLIWNGCQDLHITAEAEWNGLKYDTDLSLRRGNDILLEMAKIEGQLTALAGVPHINWGSPAHLSSLLYGGEVPYTEIQSYTFTYANPKRPPANKTRKAKKLLLLPRLVEPLKGSENDNGFSTEEGILQRLKATGKARDIIDLLLTRRGLGKLVSTYLHGLPKLAKEMNWENDIIHGQLHHCVAQTGRLASSKPNQQNLDYRVRDCIISRFPLTK